MAFLVKYLAFVVAFLSAAKLGEGINVKLVDPTNAESIQEYADLGRWKAHINDFTLHLGRKDVNAYIQLFISFPVKQDVCESFDPLNSSHMDAIGDDATTLARMLTVRKYQILATYFLVQVILNFIFP